MESLGTLLPILLIGLFVYLLFRSARRRKSGTPQRFGTVYDLNAPIQAPRVAEEQANVAAASISAGSTGVTHSAEDEPLSLIHI